MSTSILHLCALLTATMPTLPPAGTEAGPTLSHVEANGIRMRIAEQGEGPLVLLLHGLPSTWYSWRHQLGALADAGYRAVAPDLRGLGGTDAPADVEAYDIVDSCRDIEALLERLGEEEAVLVGQDMGGVVAWGCLLLDSKPFRAFVNLGVPIAPFPDRPPLELMRAAFGDNFYYSAGGILGRLGVAKVRPPWLAQEDLDYYVAEFTRTGFRGALNYYRNYDRSWKMLYRADMQPISVPLLFIGGEKDPALGGQSAEAIEDALLLAASDVRGFHLLSDAGHWIPQERAAEVNALLIEFLRSLD